MGLTRQLTPTMSALRDAVLADDGPIEIVGSASAAEVGGPVAAGARPVRVADGVLWVRPEEMTASCCAGTPVVELAAALAAVGQEVALPVRSDLATVGGALAVGRGSALRLGLGPVRDVLLQADVVLADGTVVRAGGPTVKNVSGYDLCRLLVGSLGTLAVLGEVIVRTRPLPRERRWVAGPVDPTAVRARLYRPTAVLWDGTTTWVCLDGHPRDLDEQQALVPGLALVDGPPVLPAGGRASIPIGSVEPPPGLRGPFVVEVGAGVAHLSEPWLPGTPDPAVAELHRRLKAELDPTHRLNPGRMAF